VLSRVADAIYWMSRYVERAENTARVLDVNHSLTLDGPDADADWASLVNVLGDAGLFATRYGAPTRESVLRFLVFDKEAPGSVLSCLSYARENARTVREVVSSEMWEQVNHAYLRAVEASKDPNVLEAPNEYLEEVKKASQLFVGITYLTMTHNEAWHFARLGRLLERADMTSRILDVKHALISRDPTAIGSPHDELAWGALLRSASAFEMYRKRHGQIMPSQVVAFLLFDQKFPRSVRYCLRKGERSLHAITGRPLEACDSSAEKKLSEVVRRIDRTDVGEVLARGLHGWVDELQKDAFEIGAKVYESFFAVRPDHEEPADEAAQPTQSQSQSSS
jgi:uncharacterized alpha-E superfamily protein